jgi:hypothetical protein
VVAGAGHHVHLDRPEAVQAALEEFLARVCPDGKPHGERPRWYADRLS